MDWSLIFLPVWFSHNLVFKKFRMWKIRQLWRQSWRHHDVKIFVGYHMTPSSWLSSKPWFNLSCTFYGSLGIGHSDLGPNCVLLGLLAPKWLPYRHPKILRHRLLHAPLVKLSYEPKFIFLAYMVLLQLFFLINSEFEQYVSCDVIHGVTLTLKISPHTLLHPADDYLQNLWSN